MSELVYQRDSKKQVYISLSVYRALLLLAKHSESNADVTADVILRDRLTTLYPQLFDHQKQVEQMEKELLKTL